ncbi:MAG: hypothetical protein LBN22_07445, partial [Clostridiales Family XIII bacterium]|nr:hypothetical protein [Clostridiales Family XIII bacterium]
MPENNAEGMRAKLSVLKGIGPKKVALYRKLGIENLQDLLNFYPVRYEDRRRIYKIAELRTGTASAFFGRVL